MSEKARFSATYSDYNKTLRTWFVAFGIGVPGALLLDQDARNLLFESCNANYIIYSLLIGTVIQIVIAFLNKYIAWCNEYIRSNDESEKEDRVEISLLIENVAALTEKIWIDAIADVITGLLFIVAIINLYGLFL